MRCPNCGTENAPDSRFCGGCGARMQTSGLVAPTQKISDDAPYPPASIPPQNYSPASIPPQNSYQSGPASIPPHNYQSGPTSVPPQNYTPASVPPQNTTYPPANNSIPPQNSYQTGPKSIPPQTAAPRVQTAPPIAPSTPPQGTPSQPRPRTNGVPSVSRRQTPAFSDPSITPPPRRRWGLIITVLLVDLALAGAGVYLLTEGLA
jgi:hypothetical protein